MRTNNHGTQVGKAVTMWMLEQSWHDTVLSQCD